MIGSIVQNQINFYPTVLTLLVSGQNPYRIQRLS